MIFKLSRNVLPLIALALPLLAQPGGGQGRGGPPPTAKAQAPIDLTGSWMALVNEDWKYRMVTPLPGDYNGVPMNVAARRVADAWDPAKDEASGDACKSYGAANLIRIPGNLRISWVDDNTMKVEMDAGTQTRTFHFGNYKPPANAEPSWQGESVAKWDVQRTAPGEPRHGSLMVTTTNLKAGYLRKNGVPYSDKTTLTEYWDIINEPRTNEQKIIVTTVVDDPTYLTQTFVTSTNFKKQPNDSAFKPSPCSAKW